MTARMPRLPGSTASGLRRRPSRRWARRRRRAPRRGRGAKATWAAGGRRCTEPGGVPHTEPSTRPAFPLLPSCNCAPTQFAASPTPMRASPSKVTPAISRRPQDGSNARSSPCAYDDQKLLRDPDAPTKRKTAQKAARHDSWEKQANQTTHSSKLAPVRTSLRATPRAWAPVRASRLRSALRRRHSSNGCALMRRIRWSWPPAGKHML